jgi:1,4-dihydroxy-2-naphthoyl-CoA hydrolase
MSDDFAQTINGLPGNHWVKAMDLIITHATADEVRCEWDISEKHLQGYGIVHGGVHCGVIESLASIGAHLVAAPRGQRVVGLENHTSFIRAVRSGRLRGTARPVTRGRSSQVWEGVIEDSDGKLVARGTVRLLCISEDQLNKSTG